MRESCLIVDGHSLMHRAFHALPPMDVNGVQTNAVHGFLMMLFKALEERKPEYCVIAFDEHGPVFRHEAFAEYKAGRAPMDEQLRPQFPIVKEVLAALNIGMLSLAGYEADDLLGTVSRVCQEEGIDALLLTGDRDALQLVQDGVSLLFTRKGISETTLFTYQTVKDYFGITPEQVTDWKALMGDASDNIPGVPGIGDKTAVKLLQEYGTLDALLANAGQIKGKLGEKLRDNQDSARLSKQLAVIDRRVPIETPLAQWRTMRIQQAPGVLRKYQLNVAAEKLRKVYPAAAAQPEDMPQQAAPADVRELAQPDELRAFLQAATGPVALYLDQQGLSVCGADGNMARLCFSSGQMDLLSSAQAVSAKEALAAACAALGDKPLATHDAKRLLHHFLRAGCLLPAIWWDTMVAAYLRNPQEHSFALQHFASPDAAGVLCLSRAQQEELRQAQMEKLYQDIELPLVRVLFDMETEGFQVDKQALAELGAEYTRRAQTLQRQIYQSMDVGEFNINSPQQLGHVLFEQLKLPAFKKTQRGFSTDAETLEALIEHHPSIALILEYRQIMKLLGTYIDALISKTDSQGRIHTTFDQTGTATGRISSNEPNLQNIPVRTDMGRDIRKAFVAKPGWVLVDGDYSQIELRILAHMSEDEDMCDAFIKGQDIHTRTAAEINEVAMEDVTSAMRSAAKAVNFGIVYGISDFGLARNIGISRKRAGEFIASYFAHYPGVQRYMQDAVRLGYDKGYAQTLFGRRRLLPELKSANANIRSFGERAAMNTPIQGTAADIIKAAMVCVHEKLCRSGLGARLILQVHDELILESPQQEAQQAAALLKQCMEEVLPLRVPLICEVKTGRSWYETK